MSKKLFLLPILLFGAFLMTTTTSCGDECKDVKCGDNGTCFEGECVCNEGYEGAECDLTWAAKFEGSYLGADVVTASTAGNDLGTYNLTTPAVVTSRSESSIRIANFGGFASFVDATISRANASDLTATKITIDFTDPAGRRFSGDGTYTSTGISGSYRVTYSDSTYDDATFNYTK
jgi:hypothetical protein